jgi:hypothetical protein
MTKRPVVAVLALAALLALPAADSTAATVAASSVAASASAGDAVITADLVTEPGGEGMLHVTFAPQLPGFHIYSLALPSNGIDGLGVPTRILVNGASAATGRPTADEPTRYSRIAGLDVAIPVYPDGQVTITVPVRSLGHGPTEVTVSYGLCSEARCMLPVEGLKIAIGSN